MKTAERDELLVRIDERLESLDREIKENVKQDISEIEKHAREQNGKVLDLIDQCSATTERSKTNYKLCCIAIGIGIGALTTGLNVAYSFGIIP